METLGSYGLAVIVLFVVVYFLPTMCALDRWSKNWAGIFVLNLFLGWTFVGWVVALAWAFSGENLRKKFRRERREQKRLLKANRQSTSS